jgi:hypothetical protein
MMDTSRLAQRYSVCLRARGLGLESPAHLGARRVSWQLGRVLVVHATLNDLRPFFELGCWSGGCAMEPRMKLMLALE